MRPNNANLATAESVSHQRLCRFGRVTLALMLGRHSVCDLHPAVGSPTTLPSFIAEICADLIESRSIYGVFLWFNAPDRG